jgi:hypothetical protein
MCGTALSPYKSLIIVKLLKEIRRLSEDGIYNYYSKMFIYYKGIRYSKITLVSQR